MLGYLDNPEANAKTFTEDRWRRIIIIITNIIIIIITNITINIIIIIITNHLQMDEDWGHWAHH